MTKILKGIPMDQWMVDEVADCVETIRKNLTKIKKLSNSAHNAEWHRAFNQLLDLEKASDDLAKNLAANLCTKDEVKELREFEWNMKMAGILDRADNCEIICKNCGHDCWTYEKDVLVSALARCAACGEIANLSNLDGARNG